MSLEYIRNYYRVPAEVGRGVTCYGKPGVIVGSRNAHLEVLLDEDKPGRTGYYHPTHEVVYGDMKPIRKMTRAQQRYQEYRDAADWFNGSFAEWLGCDKNTMTHKRHLRAEKARWAA